MARCMTSLVFLDREQASLGDGEMRMSRHSRVCGSKWAQNRRGEYFKTAFAECGVVISVATMF